MSPRLPLSVASACGVLRDAGRAVMALLALAAWALPASANTLTQNVSWTIDRAGTTARYRLVAYGDSISAGYNGSAFNAARSTGRQSRS